FVTRGCDDGRLTTNQITGEYRQLLVSTLRPTVFYRDVLALEISDFLKALTERCYQGRGISRRCAPQKSDHRHCGLLRARRERPRCRRAAEGSQQFPSSDGDCHTPSRARCVKETIPRHERAVPNSAAPGAGGAHEADVSESCLSARR